MRFRFLVILQPPPHKACSGILTLKVLLFQRSIKGFDKLDECFFEIDAFMLLLKLGIPVKQTIYIITIKFF